MEKSVLESLWKQFGASIDMLENAIVLCPDNLWSTKVHFWYSAYHTIFYLDYYLSDGEKFTPPEPFSLSEFDPSGIMPDRVYTKKELLEYIEFSRKKCFNLINELADETNGKRFINEHRNYSTFEIIIYNMRHVQHHAAQLNLLLRQNIDDAPKWVSQTNKFY